MNYQLHSQDYYDPSLELDFTQPWSPDNKKHGQIPRPASYYPASQSAMYDLTDDDWHRYAHSVPHYTDPSSPRIKQEDLYSDASIRYGHPNCLQSLLHLHPFGVVLTDCALMIMLTGMSRDILGLFSPLSSGSRSKKPKEGARIWKTFPWVGVYTVKDSDPIHPFYSVLLFYPACPDVENVSQQKALTAT
ncbi:hypothetical protein CVT25_012530 [Psilocybe cyanescens]|uniref:Uncharacterized protein n=1 Tax=Psilocybe cyanescens TaxID=93625 RepID=A0A409XLH8_PSICY|nr:hypothetical protein CVT25_012530 [Psilocybe cyanescens]